MFLTKAQRQDVRTEYLEANGKPGTIEKLSKKYNVSRKTTSLIINRKTKRLQEVTTEVDELKAEKRTLEYQIDTYTERVKLINLLKDLDVTPIMEKANNGKTINSTESKKLKTAIGVMEALMKGIDNMQKSDIHFHVTKTIAVIQNLDAEQSKLFASELKKRLCHQCPLWQKYQGLSK